MKTYKIILWVLAFICFGMLFVALMNIFPDSFLSEYKILIGVIFFVISGFIRKAYNKN